MYQKMWNETGEKNWVVSTYAMSVNLRATLVRCIVTLIRDKNSATMLEDLNFRRQGMLTL